VRILLINPPYRAVTSRRGTGEQVPLGLLSIGGPLLDDGHVVALIDAEANHLSLCETAKRAKAWRPELIMTGHAGSTPAHPTVIRLAHQLKRVLPQVPIIYGGVHPTYHGREILRDEPCIDVIVRGEGERSVCLLAKAYAEEASRLLKNPLAAPCGVGNGLKMLMYTPVHCAFSPISALSGIHQKLFQQPASLRSVPGLFLRIDGQIEATAKAQIICDLDTYRIGWELIDDWDRYQCWGAGRAVVIQLSRGCPHTCSYCGQRGYWTKWRHRDPQKVATEIAWLHRTHGINFVDLADENPTSSPRVWRQFLEALIEEKVSVKLFATIRADDIVRDREILPLYKKAGMECVLMGIETTNAQTMTAIRKGSTQQKDYQAIQLLRQHSIISMVGCIFGLQDERLSDFLTTFRHLIHYDPDLLNAMYVTPHRWTTFYQESALRTVVDEDLEKWDYRHQVLDTGSLRPWQTFLAVKSLEALIHIRPRFLYRLLRHPDSEIGGALRWCSRNAARVWLDEVLEYLIRNRAVKLPRTLRAIQGEPLVQERDALSRY
jgi:anaerobic magnesium-protoporphyrin IX monomethyl ester cyclase